MTSEYTYRIEVFHSSGCKAICDLFGGYHGGNWVSISHWFPYITKVVMLQDFFLKGSLIIITHCYDIGDNIISLELESPEMRTNSTKSNLDFIRDTHASRMTDVSD